LRDQTRREHLDLVKSSDFDVYKPSSTIRYTLTVTNRGPADAAGVVVTDNLPDVKQAIYLSDTGGCTKSGLVLTGNLGAVEASTTRSFDVYVKIRGRKGAVTNPASIGGATADPVASNNASTRVVLVRGGV